MNPYLSNPGLVYARDRLTKAKWEFDAATHVLADVTVEVARYWYFDVAFQGDLANYNHKGVFCKDVYTDSVDIFSLRPPRKVGYRGNDVIFPYALILKSGRSLQKNEGRLDALELIRNGIRHATPADLEATRFKGYIVGEGGVCLEKGFCLEQER